MPVAGIHIARQDSSPLIMFVGQVGRDMREREAFQELDYRAVFGSIAKWVTEIDDPARIPELVSHAFHTACNGRPGPVVIALPEDMLTERVAVPDATAFEPVESWPGLTDMSRLQKLLWAAKRPVALLGGSRWSESAFAALARFAERFALPVATTFRRGHLFDALHPCYAGDMGIGPNPKLLARVKGADLVLLIGGRLSEMSIAGLYAVRHSRTADEAGACASRRRGTRPRLSPALLPSRRRRPRSARRWKACSRRTRSRGKARRRPPMPTISPGRKRRRRSRAASISARLWCGCARICRAEAIITNGAGNFAGWIHRFYRFRKFATHVAPTSGSMGYGFPAALAMKMLHPERKIVCIAGDGDFLMTGQDFATAVQYKLPVIVVVADNGLYGTIRMHQERDYPGRVVATELKNPDFVAYAMAFGGLRRIGGEDRRFSRRLRPSRRHRQAVDHPSEDRPGSDFAGSDDHRHSRKVAAGGGGKIGRRIAEISALACLRRD